MCDILKSVSSNSTDKYVLAMHTGYTILQRIGKGRTGGFQIPP